MRCISSKHTACGSMPSSLHAINEARATPRVALATAWARMRASVDWPHACNKKADNDLFVVTIGPRVLLPQGGHLVEQLVARASHRRTGVETAGHHLTQVEQGIPDARAIAEAFGEADHTFVMIWKRGRRFRREVQEEGPRADAGRRCDLLDRRLVEALLVEQPKSVLGEGSAGLQTLQFSLVHRSTSSTVPRRSTV